MENEISRKNTNEKKTQKSYMQKKKCNKYSKLSFPCFVLVVDLLTAQILDLIAVYYDAVS